MTESIQYGLWTAWVAVKVFLGGCYTENPQYAETYPKGQPPCAHYRIQKIGRLAEEIRESSGLALLNGGTLVTHGDSGNPPRLFFTDAQGALLRSQQLPLRNRDWESLAQSGDSLLFVGDFGNNANKRRDLRVYCLRRRGQTFHCFDSLLFAFPDQQAFPPPKERKNFDCEAFFYHQSRLWFFSKNRGEGPVKVYRSHGISGRDTLELVDRFSAKGPITGAALHPSQQRIALSSYGRVYFLGFAPEKAELHPIQCRQLLRGGQTEALIYLDEQRLLVSNEKGKLYLISQKP